MASTRTSDPVGAQRSDRKPSSSIRAAGRNGAEGQRVYLGVQILRGIAASLVVLHHNSLTMAIRAHDTHLGFSAGQSGVDVFFTISGFVMVLVTASSWGRSGVAVPFLIRRIIRVVPLYWIFTALKILLILLLPSLVINTVMTPWHVAASFLFIPTHFFFPILQVGWTLSYEMLFYLLFTGLLFMCVRPVAWLSVLLTILAIAGLYRTEAWGAPTILLSPLLVEFVFGMFIGLAAVQGRFLPVRFALALASISFAALLLSNVLGTAAEPFRLLFWGIPGALLLASVVALEDWLRTRPIKWLVQVGAASYSLYLLHTMVLGAVWVAASKAKMTHGFLSYIVYGGAILTCIGVAWIIHRLLEAPMTRALTRAYYHNSSKSQTGWRTASE